MPSMPMRAFKTVLRFCTRWMPARFSPFYIAADIDVQARKAAYYLHDRRHSLCFAFAPCFSLMLPSPSGRGKYADRDIVADDRHTERGLALYAAIYDALLHASTTPPLRPYAPHAFQASSSSSTVSRLMKSAVSSSATPRSCRAALRWTLKRRHYTTFRRRFFSAAAQHAYHAAAFFAFLRFACFLNCHASILSL